VKIRILRSAPLVLLTLTLLGEYCYGLNYVAKANEEIYGTWVNQDTVNAFHIQKMIVKAGEFEEYANVADSYPSVEVTQQIDSKWTDSSGDVWYKAAGKINTGPWKGRNFKALEKLSKDASVLEMVVSAYQGNFDSADYPSKIEHNPSANGGYRIFHRAK
jgi:hypothetical protein